MNLLSFGLLYTTVASFITLWFQYINVLYPDINQYLLGTLSSIRWSTSILVVVFPVFIVTAWLLGRDFKKDPEKREVWVRRWLVYLTLFAAAITIIVDLITLVYNFLDGGLTMSFFWKILVVLLVAVAMFGYYFWDLRRTKFKSKKPRLFAIISGAVILASIIYAFFLVGTPAQQRERRFDGQRVNDLNTLQYQVIDYWTRKNVLPSNLSELSSDITGFRAPMDPSSNLPYEYRATGILSFELCADFAASNKDGYIDPKNGSVARPVVEVYPYYPDQYQQNWAHEAGRFCFTRTIDPSLYKNINGSPAPVKYQD